MWQSQKLEASSLLAVTGRNVLDEMPNMLLFWISTVADATGLREDTLSLSLLRTLDVLDIHVGNDVKVSKKLEEVVKKVNSREDLNLTERYNRAFEELAEVRFQTPVCGDISTIDQVLLPALFGCQNPITEYHCLEIKKHVLRDDTVSVSKLLGVYVSKDKSQFAFRYPDAVDVMSVRERLIPSNSAAKVKLYKTLKKMGCLGKTETKMIVPKHFSHFSVSLPLLYARALDEELEDDDSPNDDL